MRSEELGALFEKAAFGVLKEMLLRWGFDVIDSKVQRSGTQHGFDLYLRTSNGRVTHNLFVECKASASLNEIQRIELTDKLRQLDWAGFPRKDSHIFFSPTRAVAFDNQELTIEDDDWPFVVVDWMRRKDGNPALDLFATYDGSDEDVLRFRSYLLSEVAVDHVAGNTFDAVCERLQSHFERRLAEHEDASTHDGYRLITGTFWSRVQQETHSEYLTYYYTKADSSPTRLREAIANDYDVRNQLQEKRIDQVLREAIGARAALIKILSGGGEGKSTLLYRLAKSCCREHTVVWLDGIKGESLRQVRQAIQRFDGGGALLFLLDNAATYGRDLVEFAQALTELFRKHRLVLVIAEREFRYTNIEGREAFEGAFNETHTIDYRSTPIRQPIFDRLIEHIRYRDALSDEVAAEAKRIFLSDPRMTVTEACFAAIQYLKATAGLRGYRFDWEDWADFCSAKAPNLRRLYLILATFYQFGFSLDVTICLQLLPGVDEIDIHSALRESQGLPIYRRGRHLYLRHETIASWFLDGSDEQRKANRLQSETVFRQFLGSISTPQARDLFMWICIKNRDFRRSYLGTLVDDGKRAEILAQYIAAHPGELKCRTELSKIYQQQKRWDEAIRLLLEYLALDPGGWHPRTELSKIYQQQKRWKEAEDILLELKRLDPDNLQARTELSKIYQHQKRWKEAEDILLESLKIDPQQLHPRTELSKIYQQQKRWDEAIRLLLEYLALDPGGWHPRTELSKIYQQQKRWKEAEDILLESLKIDPQQLHPRTELSKIYQHQKRWKEAEDILLELKRLDPDNLQARTELSKIYQHQKRWKEAEDILLELKRLDPDNLQARTELSKIYQQQKRWKEAEDILLESLKIDPQQLHPRTELSKIYQHQKRWKEAEDILLELKRLDPDNLQARTELSKIYQQQKRWKEAEDILEEVLHLEPSDVAALTELAILSKKSGRMDRTEELLLKCLAIKSHDVNAMLELGKLYSADPARYGEAERHFKNILVIEPTSLHAKTELASLYRKMQKWPEREKLLFDLYETGDADAFVLAALAHTFSRFRKHRVSLKLLEKSAALRPGNLLTLLDFITIHAMMRDKQGVEKYLQQAEAAIAANPWLKDVDVFRGRLERVDLRFMQNGGELCSL